MKPPRIGIDFSTLDQANVGQGQHRYVVDFINGLAAMDTNAEFVVFGSRPKPIASIAGVFEDPRRGWAYRPVRTYTGRGLFFVEQIQWLWRPLLAGLDLLHAPVPAPCLLVPCRSIVTIHDLMFELFPEYRRISRSKSYRLARWIVQHRTRRVIAISANTRRDLMARWGLQEGRIDTILHGCSFLERGISGPVSPTVPAGAREPFILSPYNLEPRKNLGGLLDAFGALAPSYPKIRLVLYGRAAWTAPREEAFKARLAELGLAERVELTGFVDDAQLRQLYRQALVFVFPTLYEGFGYPLLEAMAEGACVLARNASSMPEIVGDAGVLVETADPAELRSGIEGLLRDEAQRNKLQTAARQRAAAFTVKRMAQATYAAYLKALE